MSEENDIILEKQVDDEEEPSIKPVKNKKEPAPDGRKKPRTQAQLDAFKKMRENRMKLMEEKKNKPLETPVKKEKKPKIIQGDSDSSSDDEPIVRRKRSNKKAQVVNNYYYGMPPPHMMPNQPEPKPEIKPEPKKEPDPKPEPKPVIRKPRIQFA